MEERLVSLLRGTFSDLDEIWRSVGVTAKERAELVDGFFSEMSELCRTRVDTEKSLAASYEDEVKKLKEDIAICCERLDLVRTVPVSTEKLPLVRELTMLRGDYQELDKKRTEMENMMSEKLSLVQRCWEDMKMTYEPGFDMVGFKLSTRRLNEIEHKYAQVKAEKDRRQVLVRSRVSEAFQLMQMLELDENPATPLDYAIVSQNEQAIGLGMADIDALDRRIMELQTERQAREALMMRLISEIQSLWQRLDVPTSERESFIRRHGTFGDKSVKAMEAKLGELKELRKQRMSHFIEKVRAEMRAALQEVQLLSMERSRLTRIMSEPVSGDDYEQAAQMLARHEQELEQLKKVVDAIRPITKTCQKYLQLCKDRVDYEALILDSARLLSRKPGALSLQEEEKMRKRVLDIPKTVAQLKQMVEDYEKNYLSGEKLILSEILGEDRSVVQVVENSEREHEESVKRGKEERANKKLEQEKPAPLGKKTTTGAPSTVKRIPMKQKN